MKEKENYQELKEDVEMVTLGKKGEVEYEYIIIFFIGFVMFFIGGFFLNYNIVSMYDATLRTSIIQWGLPLVGLMIGAVVMVFSFPRSNPDLFSLTCLLGLVLIGIAEMEIVFDYEAFQEDGSPFEWQKYVFVSFFGLVLTMISYYKILKRKDEVFFPISLNNLIFGFSSLMLGGIFLLGYGFGILISSILMVQGLIFILIGIFLNKTETDWGMLLAIIMTGGGFFFLLGSTFMIVNATFQQFDPGNLLMILIGIASFLLAYQRLKPIGKESTIEDGNTKSNIIEEE